MSTTMPRSVLRHRPIQADIQEWVIDPARVTRSSQLPTTRPTLIRVSHLHPLVMIGASMLVMLLFLWIAQGIWTWSSIQLDTLQYGFPRTTHREQSVGHGGNSIFLATNQHGQIYILEIPENNTTSAHLLVGPHLLGSGADLAPVHIAFQGNPRHPDLLIEVQNIIMRFHNTGNTYVPIAAPS